MFGEVAQCLDIQANLVLSPPIRRHLQDRDVWPVLFSLQHSFGCMGSATFSQTQSPRGRH